MSLQGQCWTVMTLASLNSKYNTTKTEETAFVEPDAIYMFYVQVCVRCSDECKLGRQCERPALPQKYSAHMQPLTNVICHCRITFR